MEWHLLNQYCEISEFNNSAVWVLEEVISSELQLAQVLASGVISLKTMTSHFPGLKWNNPVSLTEESRL